MQEWCKSLISKSELSALNALEVAKEDKDIEYTSYVNKLSEQNWFKRFNERCTNLENNRRL